MMEERQKGKKLLQQDASDSERDMMN